LLTGKAVEIVAQYYVLTIIESGLTWTMMSSLHFTLQCVQYQDKLFFFTISWSVADPDRRLGGSQIGGRQKCLHLLKYQRLSATIVVCHTKEVIFCRSKSGYFCWSNYAIFQGITTVWKRFISLFQKTFETGPKQRASFFTSYTDLVYLQNVFKRYENKLRASHCFGYP